MEISKDKEEVEIIIFLNTLPNGTLLFINFNIIEHQIATNKDSKKILQTRFSTGHKIELE